MSTLKEEITNDPLLRGYAGMNAQQILADGNIKYRTRNITRLDGSTVLNGIDSAEWLALTDVQKRRIWDVVHITGGINLFGLELTIFRDVFGDVSTTASNLSIARVEFISRWNDLGLGNVKVGHIERARS